MKIIKKEYINQIVLIISVFALLFIVFHHTMRIKKLEKDMTILKEEMYNVCDVGMETVKGLANNQVGLAEAFKEIQKLKQLQKGIIYH